MMRTNVGFIASSCGGTLVEGTGGSSREVLGLTWDSRRVSEGCCFLAIPGEKVDGNDFIVPAMSAGAAVVICTREPSASTVAIAGEFDCALVRVDDPLSALSSLASAYRDTLHAKVVGVTGSSGKTTTKNLIAAVLDQGFTVVATEGNQNNELGVPATVLSADEDTSALVVEMGMRGRGQIEALARFVKPQIGVITNIGVSHMELLGSRENIALAKGELIDALPNDGCAILWGDDDFTPSIVERSATPRGLQVIRYGLSESCDVQAVDLAYDEDGYPSFRIVFPTGGTCNVTLKLQGEHNVRNALAAAAVGFKMGLPAPQIAHGLQATAPQTMRLQVIRTPDGKTILDDTYNANPDSMRAAILTLSTMKSARRRVAVLGDMGELGQNTELFHRQVGAFATANGVNLLVCVGKLAAQIGAGATEVGMDATKVHTFPDCESATAFLKNELGSGDVVLVKASRASALERIVKEIAS